MEKPYQLPFTRRESSTVLRVLLGNCGWAFVLTALMSLAGCQEDLGIRKYKVAKKDSNRSTLLASKPSVGQEQQMLGAIVPHSTSAWFFKLQGDPSLILKNRDEFRSIVDSVKFKSSGEPSWKLADGWEDQVTGGGITYAKLIKQDEGLTATVTTLATPAIKDENEWRGYVVQNVNRWRGQLGLEAGSWDAIKPDLEEVEELSTGPAKAYFVSLVGKSDGSSFRPPFMSGASSGRVPDASPTSTEPGATTADQAEVGLPAQSSSLTFDVPEGWKETDASKSQMRLAAFSIASEGEQAEATVISAGGDIRANMQMWFGQISLEPSEDAVATVLGAADEVKVGQQAAKVYWLDGSETPSKQSIMVADVPWKTSESLFVKLKGDARLVATQKQSFLDFVQSLKWQ